MLRQIFYALVLFVLSLIIPGKEVAGNIPRETITLTDIYRLTCTPYPEIHPRIIVDEEANVGVFWTSLKLRTPQIEGGWFEGGQLVRIKEIYSCVGGWDVAVEGSYDIWLIRSHWGTLYVHRIRNLREIQKWVVVEEKTADPCIGFIAGRPFLLWREKITSEKENLRAAYLRAGRWQIFSLLSGRKIRFPRIEEKVGKRREEFLILAQVEEDGKWFILAGKMKDFLFGEVNFQKLPFLFYSPGQVCGIIDKEKRGWVSWMSGEETEEKVFLSFSFDLKNWNTPFSVYPFPGKVINPELREFRDFIYIFYQLWDENMERWLIRGTKFLRADSTRRSIVEFCPILAGEEFDSIVAGDTIWLAWQKDGEIYLGKGSL